MKLHYSQTEEPINSKRDGALLPYEITLLSNHAINVRCNRCALLPYEITLLSN